MNRLVLAFALTATASLPIQGPACADSAVIGLEYLSNLEEYIGNKRTQEELRLNEGTVGKVKALIQEYRSAGDDVRAKELGKDKEREALQELDVRFNKSICGLLGPGQQKRLRQIHLQAIAIAAFEDGQVHKELGLSKEQLTKVQQIVKETRKQAEDAAEEAIRKGAGQFDPAPIYEKGMKRIVEQLTDDQRVAWEVMLGRPFQRD